MSAFAGLLLLRGVYWSHGKPVHCLWEPDARPVFRATASREHFQILVERKAVDKFTHIRDVFNSFTTNCEKYYNLSESATIIDETLRKFRGRCKFRVYMPQKPGKYGLLFRVMTDSNTRYVSKMIPYADTHTSQAANANGVREGVCVQ